MYERLLVRYGDLNLKGKNIKYFIDKANHLIREKLAGINVGYDFRHDRIYILLHDNDPQTVIERLNRVSGLYSYSLISKCAVNMDELSS